MSRVPRTTKSMETDQNSMRATDADNDDDEKWVHDSSLDHKKRLPLRASTGVWKAALFVIGLEFAERISYYVIGTSLITYLTKVMHQDLPTAAKNVNYWMGVTTMMPLFGAFLADSYCGRFQMVTISSVIYLMGLGLLAMSQLIPNLKPNRSLKLHEVMFFLAIYLVSVGTGGHKPSIESFGADQFDDHHLEERKKKMSFFNWWNFTISFGLILAVTVIAHIQGRYGWVSGNIIVTVVMAVALVVFLTGKRFYRYRTPQGSPFTPMLQVIVAAFRKRNVPYYDDPAQLHEEVPVANSNYKHKQRLLLRHTNKYRFLDKAAIKAMDDQENYLNDANDQKQINPWRLCTVTRVEELKLVLNLIPIWLSTLTFGICQAQVTTFYIKQASSMNKKISHNLELPPAAIFCLTAVGVIVTVSVYDRVVVPILRRVTGNERGISILMRVGVGMVICSLSLIIAALVETKRLGMVSSSSTSTRTMSVFWLVPQFLVFGTADGFVVPGLQELFYGEVPESMRSMGIAFMLCAFGFTDFCSSFLITLVEHITSSSSSSRMGSSSGTQRGWFGKDLNHSRVDKFYWLLAILNGLNLCLYAFIARRYIYKQAGVRRRGSSDNDDEDQLAA